MTAFVVDASALLAAYFNELPADRVEAVFGRLEAGNAIVPSLFPVEIFNAMEMTRRRQRFDRASIESFTRSLLGLIIEVRPAPTMAQAAALRGLAELHRLTVYDAAYLALARDEIIELVTLDDDLAKAAEAAGVTVVRP